MTKSIYILGTALSHDGSSCLLKDGRIVVAIEKERITRKKHDGFNDNATLQYCLSAAGITFDDLDLIVEENTTNAILKPGEMQKRLPRIIPDNVRRVGISHHLAHAYSAVGTSPFMETAVVVMDGQGSSLDTCIDVNDSKVLPKEIAALPYSQQYLYWEKESYYIFKDGKMHPIFKDFSKFHIWDRFEYPVAPFDMEHFIAEFYGGMSYYIFDEEFCEGKLMGLAPYGRSNRLQYNAFEFTENRVFLKKDWMKNFDPYRAGRYCCFSEHFQYYADLAYWAQTQIEKAMTYLFNAYFRLYPHDNLAYAGGLALNAVANSKLFDTTLFTNFYFQPAASDSGLAMGCCYYGWIEVLKKEKIIHHGSPYFGRVYDQAIIQKLLEQYCAVLTIERTEKFIIRSAEFLADGKIIGWFQGGSEFGPRALGNRSILADPRRKDIRNFINKYIKNREDFRPFAPSVLLEDVEDYFEIAQESPYMILVAKTKAEWINVIPAVVHTDHSARVQTVSYETNLYYYSLISEFKKITNISVLMNTSFNGRSMPIVETPQEAIEFFIKTCDLDVLVLHDYIIQRLPK